MNINKSKLSNIFKILTIGIILQFNVSSNALAKEAYTMKEGGSELVRPTGYREWVYVGTPVTPNDMNNGKAAFPEHHNVYIDPKSWKQWKRK